jgi:S-adenosylmethionine synthetase
MFGYACRETDSLMPAPIDFAHRLMRRHRKVRDEKTLPWLGPDAKAQVTVLYRNGKPAEIDTIVLSTQHAKEIDGKEVKDHDCRVEEAVIENIIRPALPDEMLQNTKKFLINPTGVFVEGGPKADCGLTGRKIIVDTYGGACPHGGGAFSGKDPTKVDRSAAYCARRIAKTVVAAKLADKCLVQIAYAIGVAKPVSFMIDTMQTGKIPDAEIAERVQQHDVFDLTPKGIIRDLKLWRPIFRRTAAYGHFGREEPEFIWENTDLADKIRER